MPAHKDPLKPVGIREVDQQIEVFVESLQAAYEAFIKVSPEKRQALLLSSEIQLRDSPAVEDEDNHLDIVFDEDGRIWSGYRSDGPNGWAQHPVAHSYFDGEYGVRFWLRQIIKDFINYPVVLDDEIERNPVIKVCEIYQCSVTTSKTDISASMQRELGVPHLLTGYETVSINCCKEPSTPKA